MQNLNYFGHLKKSYLGTTIRCVKVCDTLQLEDKILDPLRFSQYINNIIESKLQNGQIHESQVAQLKQQKNYIYDQAKIKQTLIQLRSIIRKQPIQSALVTGNLIADHLAKGLYIEQSGLNKVRGLMKEKAVKIIYVPLQRSMIDICVLQLINTIYDMQLGFSFIGIDEMPMKFYLEAFK